MTTTIGADDLSPHSIGIWNPLDRTLYLIIETRPPAVRVELVLGSVQVRAAPPTRENPLGIEPIVLAGVRRLCALVYDYAFF